MITRNFKIIHLPWMAILIVVSTIAIFEFSYVEPLRRENTKSSVLEQLLTNIAKDTSLLELAAQQNNLSQLRRYASNTTVIKGFKSAVIIDPQGMVIASNDLSIENKHFKSLKPEKVDAISAWFGKEFLPQFVDQEALNSIFILESLAFTASDFSSNSKELGMLLLELDFSPYYSEIEEEVSSLALTTIFLIIIVGVPLQIILYWRLSRRLKILIQEAEKISQVDSSNALPKPDLGNDELGQLSQSFYTMAQTLISGRQQLQNLNEELLERNIDLALVNDQFKRSQSLAKFSTWVYDVDNQTVSWMLGSPNMIGKTTSQTHSPLSSLLEEVHPDDQEKITNAIELSLKLNQRYDVIHRVNWPDDTIHWLHQSGNLYTDRNGKRNLSGVTHDITDSYIERSKIIELGNIIERSVNEVLIFDTQNYEFKFANTKAQFNLGCAMEELTHHTPLDFQKDLVRSQFDAILKPLMDETEIQISYETMVTRKNGSRYFASISLQLSKFEGKDCFIAFVIDNSEIRRAQKALDISKQQQNAIIESLVDALVIIDSSQQMIVFNKAAELMFGYTREEAIGQHVTLLMCDDDAKKHMTAIDKYIDRKSSSIIGHSRELVAKRKDGSTFPILLGISELIVKEGSDQAPKNTRYFIGLMQDQTEIKRQQDHLRQAKKMEAVGQLTGGIAHDFNNLLGIISGNIELLKRKLPEDHFAHKRLQNALDSVARGTKITQSLLSFARKDETMVTLCNVNQLLKQIEPLLLELFSKRILLHLELSEDIALCKIEQSGLENALINLVINARDAIEETGSITIKTYNCDLPLNVSDSVKQLAVCISVTDTGCGMDKKTQEHILEPFFTTKPNDKGTGLGLSMVYGFCERSKGNLLIDSELGKGSTIQICLPATNIKSQLAPIEQKQVYALKKGKGKILVVDDEELLAELASEFLEGAGYHTLVANNGDEALQALQEHSDIDILFSDVVMPGNFNGFALAEEALKQNSDIKVLLASGYSKIEENHIDMSNPLFKKLREDLLTKPYSQKELVDKISQIAENL